MANRPILTLFFDIISPFGHIAAHILKTSPTFKDCNVVLVPIFLGGVMQATDNRPPLKIKNKNEYIGLSRDRFTKKFKIPICEDAPQPFPQPTLTTQRALCVIEKDLGAEKLSKAVGALYQAFWVEKQTIGDLDVIKETLGKVLGPQEVEGVMSKIATPETKALLNANTQRALDAGCFGVPFFQATNGKGQIEVFWGVDHMGMVAEHLGLSREGEPGLRAML